jgi:hypothetical protein
MNEVKKVAAPITNLLGLTGNAPPKQHKPTVNAPTPDDIRSRVAAERRFSARGGRASTMLSDQSGGLG